MPELAALEVLLTVARTGSLNAAAAELGVTQQAVSARVSALEAQTGVSLVVRGPRDHRAPSWRRRSRGKHTKPRRGDRAQAETQRPLRTNPTRKPHPLKRASAGADNDRGRVRTPHAAPSSGLSDRRGRIGRALMD